MTVLSRVHAADTTVAVATNFQIPGRSLADAFQVNHPQHHIKLVSGSTGKLYAQIVYGAPFDLFLAADQARPAVLEQQGFAVSGTLRTYATGQLALLGRKPVNRDSLNAAGLTRLALANPKLAPYGQAALETLNSLGVEVPGKRKILYAENVGQVYALVATGNADAAFVASSLLQPADSGNAWLVPANLHQPIRQDLVLLKHGAGNAAALAFLEFLSGPRAATIIRSSGYLIDTP